MVKGRSIYMLETGKGSSALHTLSNWHKGMICGGWGLFKGENSRYSCDVYVHVGLSLVPRLLPCFQCLKGSLGMRLCT